MLRIQLIIKIQHLISFVLMLFMPLITESYPALSAPAFHRPLSKAHQPPSEHHNQSKRYKQRSKSRNRHPTSREYPTTPILDAAVVA